MQHNGTVTDLREVNWVGAAATTMAVPMAKPSHRDLRGGGGGGGGGCISCMHLLACHVIPGETPDSFPVIVARARLPPQAAHAYEPPRQSYPAHQVNVRNAPGLSMVCSGPKALPLHWTQALTPNAHELPGLHGLSAVRSETLPNHWPPSP